ncbi:MAG: diaminopimelate epimerase [Oscillospiraceae bacterium]|nr:diaminopimelate epimerase [Oscillospiraceae bacterium]
MKLDFTKLEGCKNDYIYIDCLKNDLYLSEAQIASLSDRRGGIGSDGVIFIRPSESADAFMDVYNADGSRALMCGNGIRCTGKYLFDRGLCGERAAIETLSGVKQLSIIKGFDGSAAGARVGMGKALLEGDPPLPLNLAGRRFECSLVNMGNPHAVVFLDESEDLDSFELGKYGSELSLHPLFPVGVNASFAKPLDGGTLKLRVFERGSGETAACGTAASAAAFAAKKRGLAGVSALKVLLPGGELIIELSEDDEVYMTGSAREVFSGSVLLRDERGDGAAR